MLKANFAMRVVNKTDVSSTIHAPYFGIDQIETHALAKSRMKNLENRGLNSRWMGTLGNINF